MSDFRPAGMTAGDLAQGVSSSRRRFADDVSVCLGPGDGNTDAPDSSID